MGTKLPLLQKSERRRRQEGLPPKAVAAAAAAPTKGSGDPSKMPQTLNYQKPQSPQKFNQKTSDGEYPSQLEICKQWEAEMERLNTKYNLDCFSDFKLNSESDEGE